VAAFFLLIGVFFEPIGSGDFALPGGPSFCFAKKSKKAI